MKNNTKQIAPEEISAMILEKLKERAEEYLGKKVTQAVITVPANFNDAQRQATKDAGRIAGLEVLRILNEPTAAALAYELQKKYEDSTGTNVLIYDFGGGTFDVSIITIEDGVLDVKATNGETFLGGDDIDKNIADHFIKEFKQKHNIDLSKVEKAVRRFQNKAEMVKRNLSSTKSTNVEIEYISSDKDFYSDFSRAQLEHLNSAIFKKTIKCVENTLKEAKMTKSDINEIVLVGGSSRIPKIRQMVQEYFNNKELNASLHPDEAVAIGAARQAAILSGAGSVRIKSVLLYDVCSLSLGIGVEGDVMSTIIPRNTKLPATHTRLYETSQHNQTVVVIDVFEGERKMIKNNRKLGTFKLTGLPAARRGQVKLNITFDVDTNGILQCSATTRNGNNKSNLTITSIKNHLTEQEIQEMIMQAEQFRNEDEIEKQKIEAKIDLQNYCYDVISNIDDVKVSKQIKDKILRKCEEILEFLSSTYLSIQDIQRKKNEIFNLYNPFLE